MTVLAEFIVTRQVVLSAVSHPVHPVKTARKFGTTVKVTTDALLNAAEQLPPQLMPAGLDVIVPSPTRPDFVTVSVNCTVKVPALVAVPPGAVTLSGPVVAPAGTEV